MELLFSALEGHWSLHYLGWWWSFHGWLVQCGQNQGAVMIPGSLAIPVDYACKLLFPCNLWLHAVLGMFTKLNSHKVSRASQFIQPIKTIWYIGAMLATSRFSHLKYMGIGSHITSSLNLLQLIVTPLERKTWDVGCGNYPSYVGHLTICTHVRAPPWMNACNLYDSLSLSISLYLPSISLCIEKTRYV